MFTGLCTACLIWNSHSYGHSPNECSEWCHIVHLADFLDDLLEPVDLILLYASKLFQLLDTASHPPHGELTRLSL